MSTVDGNVPSMSPMWDKWQNEIIMAYKRVTGTAQPHQQFLRTASSVLNGLLIVGTWFWFDLNKAFMKLHDNKSSRWSILWYELVGGYFLLILIKSDWFILSSKKDKIIRVFSTLSGSYRLLDSAYFTSNFPKSCNFFVGKIKDFRNTWYLTLWKLAFFFKRLNSK